MKSSTPSRVTWLHLSDFHLRVNTAWSQDQVLSTLLDDVRARYSGENAPDLLFLTGDFAFSGKAEEYVLAEEFVRELGAAVNLTLDRLCVIPGNHDIDLAREEDAVVGARVSLGTALEVDRFFENEGRRKTLFARQMAFRDFANRLSPSSTQIYAPSSYAHTRTLQVGAIRVRVILLDSTWLAGGGPSDAGQLLVGERQLLDCGGPDDGCLTFALIHHPFAWLREFEQFAVENLVMRCAQICLRGHVHAHDLRETHGRQGRLTTFTAGAAFQNRTADNTYLWCSLDLTTGLGEKVVHRYSHAQHHWDAGEKETWSLPPATPRTSDISGTHRTLVCTNVPFASYVTCLVSDLQTDVPVRLTNGRVAFVAYGAILPGTENRCGDLIQKLRNHFYWKRVWHTPTWEAHLRELTAKLAVVFGEFDGVAGDELSSHDSTGAALLEAFGDKLEFTSPACDEISNLLLQNDLERARVVLQRWLEQDILRADEILELRRLEIYLLLAEDRAHEAMDRGLTLVQAPGRTPADIALAARSAFDANEHARAAALMHDALDAKVSVDTAVRNIALRIAGAAGDARLTERVRR